MKLNLFTYINTINFVDATLLEEKKKSQMISLINTDLAKNKIPNKHTKIPKQMYTLG